MIPEAGASANVLRKDGGRGAWREVVERAKSSTWTEGLTGGAASGEGGVSEGRAWLDGEAMPGER